MVFSLIYNPLLYSFEYDLLGQNSIPFEPQNRFGDFLKMSAILDFYYLFRNLFSNGVQLN